jgi:transcriptional regulator with XRE-family HTH domain
VTVTAVPAVSVAVVPMPAGLVASVTRSCLFVVLVAASVVLVVAGAVRGGVVSVCHATDCRRRLRLTHTILRMTQDAEVDALVRARIRGLRLAKGWSLDDLAARCYLSPSTLSRIETGHRRIGLDQLTAIARALGASLDQLVETAGDAVVIKPHRHPERGMTTWVLSGDHNHDGLTVARIRITRPASRKLEEQRVHPGRDWFTVLSGTVELLLGEREVLVEEGEAASFSTMTPHAFGARGGPAEVIAVFDPDGERTHVDT